MLNPLHKLQMLNMKKGLAVMAGTLFALSAHSPLSLAQEDMGERIDRTFAEIRPVRSKEEMKRHIGLTIGINSPKGEADAAPELSLNFGYQPYIPFGVGGEISTSKLDDESQHQRTTVLARASYNFGGNIPIIRSSYLGIGTGPTFVSDEFEWSLVPLLGFDLPLQRMANENLVTFGVNAKYVLTTDSPNSLVTNAAIKYWF